MAAWNMFSKKKTKKPQEQQADSAEQQFSTAGEYGLKILAEGDQDSVELVLPFYSSFS
jgi:hypothetical protein